MFIRIEETPNPSTLKFLPDQEILAKGTANFENQEDASRSPLALRLLVCKGWSACF